MKIYSFLFILILFVTSCTSIKMDEVANAKPLVEFTKGACYGDCPAYNMQINTDGSIVYNGRFNVEKLGEHKANLSKKEYVNLVKLLDKAHLDELENTYDSEILDGQITKVVYHGQEEVTSVATKFTLPGRLEEVINTLEGIANNENIFWYSTDAPQIEDSSKDDVVKDDKPTRQIVSYSQGPCFGTCPYYSLDILSDRSMLFVGKRFVDKEGIYEKTISDEKFDALMDLLKSDEFMNLESVYDENVMDAQQFVVKYYDEKGIEKSVSTKITQNERLVEIITLIQSLADDNGWKKKEAKDAVTIPEESILVSLSPKVEAKKWINSKKHLDLKIVRFLSPNGTYFLVSYDKSLDINRVMEELRRDKDVLNVSPGDRPAKPRGGVETGTSGKHGKARIIDEN